MKLSEVNSPKKFNFSCIYKWTNLINGKEKNYPEKLFVLKQEI